MTLLQHALHLEQPCSALNVASAACHQQRYRQAGWLPACTRDSSCPMPNSAWLPLPTQFLPKPLPSPVPQDLHLTSPQGQPPLDALELMALLPRLTHLCVVSAGLGKVLGGGRAVRWTPVACMWRARPAMQCSVFPSPSLARYG